MTTAAARRAVDQTSTSSPRRALSSVPWLAAVPPETLDALAEQAVLHRAPQGVRLFEQAETPAFAQFLLSGSVELLAASDEEETLVELVRPIDLVLPAAVLTRQPYLVGARVHDDAQLLMVHAESFRRAVASEPALSLAVLACQAAQFRRQMKSAKAIRLRSAEARIGCYLYGLHVAAGADAVRLPMEKRFIAAQLGMTRETFSRALPALAGHGLRVTGDVLHVDDPAAAKAAFPLDPLIDGPESITPLNIPRA